MPRPPAALPADDALLSKAEAGAICKVSAKRWPRYAERFPSLRRAMRVVQVNPDGVGRRRWLKSAVIEHMHRELAREQAARPTPVAHAPEEVS